MKKNNNIISAFQKLWFLKSDLFNSHWEFLSFKNQIASNSYSRKINISLILRFTTQFNREFRFESLTQGPVIDSNEFFHHVLALFVFQKCSKMLTSIDTVSISRAFLSILEHDQNQAFSAANPDLYISFLATRERERPLYLK